MSYAILPQCHLQKKRKQQTHLAWALVISRKTQHLEKMFPYSAKATSIYTVGLRRVLVVSPFFLFLFPLFAEKSLIAFNQPLFIPSSLHLIISSSILHSQLYSFFLDASTHLYKRVCPSVRPSVGPWVRQPGTRSCQ